MPLDLANLKARLGITDTSQDAAIEAVAAQAQDLCEQYCDRKFDLLADSETFFDPGPSLLVRRWPIAAAPPPVVTFPDGSQVEGGWPGWRVDHALGAIYVGYGYGIPAWWLGPMTVEYTGGLDPWPPALTWAVTNAFDVLWSETPGGAIPPGPPGGAGGVRRYAVVGAFSVETSGGAVGEVGANEGTGWGPFPASITRALDDWRRESRIGAG